MDLPRFAIPLEDWRIVTPRASRPAVKQYAPGWDQLKKNVKIAKISRQNHQAKFQALQEKDTVLECPKLVILCVPLQAAQYPG